MRFHVLRGDTLIASELQIAELANLTEWDRVELAPTKLGNIQRECSDFSLPVLRMKYGKERLLALDWWI